MCVHPTFRLAQEEQAKLVQQVSMMWCNND
jgi:hypothetical protein